MVEGNGSLNDTAGVSPPSNEETSGVDWLSLRLSFESEGVAVTQEELGKCLAEGRRYVRLADGSFARLDAQKVRDVLLRQAEILATGGGQGGKLPLSQAGRLQELLDQVGRANVSDGTKERVKARLAKNIPALKRLAKFTPYAAGETFTVADAVAFSALPTTAQATKAVLGEDMIAAAGIDWKSHLRMLGERPSVQRVNADRKRDSEANMALRAAQVASGGP